MHNHQPASAPTFDPTTQSHRRRNKLTGQWVIVSPHRTKRPWSGATAEALDEAPPTHDADCYLCPGNTRAGGSAQNPHYASTFVFDNDFAALHPDGTRPESQSRFLETQSAAGECRVICFSPDHSLTLADMATEEIGTVIDLWKSQTIELEATYRWVQVFETRGEICGSSNPHPHGQVWASDFMPDEPAKELIHQREYLQAHGSHLLLDYLEQEIELGERTVLLNDNWAVLVPYWAYCQPQRPDQQRPRQLGQHSQTNAHRLQPTIQHAISLLLRMAQRRQTRPRHLATPRPLLPATTPFCRRGESPGKL